MKKGNLLIIIFIFLLVILTYPVNAPLPASMEGCVDSGAGNVFAKQSCYDYFIKSLADCDKISESRFRDTCLWRFAEESNNPNICLKMTNPSGCITKLSKSLDENICTKLTDEDSSQCYYTLALQKLNSNICLKIPSLYRQGFDPVECIMKIAVENKNYKECGKLSNLPHPNKIHILDSCYFNYAKKIGTSESCKYINRKDLKDGCYNRAGFGFNFYWLSRFFLIILVNLIVWFSLITIYSYKRFKSFDTLFLKNKFKAFGIGLFIGLFFFFAFNINIKSEIPYIISLLFLALTMIFLKIPITILRLIGLKGYTMQGEVPLYFPFASPFLIGVIFIFLWIAFIFLLSYFKNNWEKTWIKITTIVVILLFIILNIYYTFGYWMGGLG